MAQHRINVVTPNKHQASLFLVGLLWLALATCAQAAGRDTPGRTEMGAHPANATSAAAASVGSDLLLYNPDNGSATFGTLYADGQFITSAYYPPYSWTRGWSHVVRANGMLFFYRQSDGFWATTRADQNGYTTTLRSGYTSIAQIGRGFVHVVSTPNGILICRGSLERFFPTLGGGIVGQVGSDGSFRVTYSGRFDAWAKVLNTPNGLFFWKPDGATVAVAAGRIQPNGIFVQTFGSYLSDSWHEQEVVAVGNNLILFTKPINYPSIDGVRALLGKYRVAEINSASQFALKSKECSQTLPSGFISPTVIGNDLFLYAFSGGEADHYLNPGAAPFILPGWATVLTFGGSEYFYPNPLCKGKPIIKQEYPEGSFAAGWSKIVNTANGVFFHNPNTGAVMVGNFDGDGNFTQTQGLGNWLAPGYTMVIKVTD